MTLFLESSKSNKDGVWLNVKATGLPHMCPVKAMVEYRRWRPSSQSDVLFLHIKDGSPLTAPQVNHVLKLALQGLVPPQLKFSSHSLRIGSASQLADSNMFDDSEIQDMGRWVSDAYQGYIRPLDSYKGPMGGEPTIDLPNSILFD